MVFVAISHLWPSESSTTMNDNRMTGNDFLLFIRPVDLVFHVFDGQALRFEVGTNLVYFVVLPLLFVLAIQREQAFKNRLIGRTFFQQA